MNDALQESLRPLEHGKGVGLRLPHGGRFRMDRPLPFIVVYRGGVTEMPAEVEKLATVHASYASFDFRCEKEGLEILRQGGKWMRERFGAFLVLEVWPDQDAVAGRAATASRLRPYFEVRPGKATAAALPDSLTLFEKALAGVEVHRRAARVEVAPGKKSRPDGMEPIFEPGAVKLRFYTIGLQLRPVFLNLETRVLFPLLFQDFLNQLSLAIKEMFFEFARSHTTREFSHYYSLGPRTLTKTIREVDRELAACSDSFSFLLQVTPLNAEAAWRAFARGGHQKEPLFAYRPLPVDPELLKRQLYSIPIERVEDPALSSLFRRKRNEVDRQLTMLFDVDTPRFLHGSLQLYGGVEEDLVELAHRILRTIPAGGATPDNGKGAVSDFAFARRAEQEIAHYRALNPAFDAAVEVRADLPPGILVSGDQLFVGKGTRLARDRVEGLIQHEVGTHLLTHFNGRSQPLEQLHAGLAGYEELQEGLATFAEYLVGQFNHPRLRLLAARVVAVGALLEGASFVETFRLLRDEHDFAPRSAFITAMRVHRGGGFSKDAVYLRGLRDLLLLLQGEHELSSLYLGKIAFDQIPLIEELLHRKILKASSLLPRLFELDAAKRRYERAQRGLTVLDLGNEQPL